MCGRYTLSYTDLDAVVRALDAILEPAAAELHHPRYNIAPTNRCVVAHAGDDRPVIDTAVWGFRRDGRLVINARSESASSRFREAYTHRRAVVPADGFYEWTGEQGHRRPIWFHAPDGGPLFMAALLDAPDDPSAPPPFAILTTAARPPVAEIHERMPVLLTAASARRWMLEKPPRVIAPDEIGLATRAVSQRVSSVAHDDAACLAPETGPAKGKQLGLF